ncbi:dbo [Symbiodinium microadriaticum]|nr:dbo [Symbiodinium microadriaticum]
MAGQESLVKEVAALQEELAALSELLFCSGILCEGRFRAQLHRRRFRRMLARFPLEAEGDLVNLQIAMNSRDIAASVFAFVGFPVSGFRAGSKALSKSATPAELKASSVGRLFVVGGESNGQYLASAEVFNPDLDRWEDVPPMSSPRSFGAVASLRGKLYICGGSDGLQVTQRVVAYAPSSEQWTEMPSMVHRREGSGAASCNGLLVVAGGGDGVDLHISSECLNPESGGCWMLLPNMEEPRLGCAAVSLNGQVYVCGGCGRRGSLATVDRYNSAEGQWEAVRPMRDARERFAAAVVHGFIYVCGGWVYGHEDPSARVLRSVERFDPHLGHWEDLAPMPQRRHGVAAAALEGQLWVCGGSYGRQDVRTVEVYDVDTFAWVQMPSMHMPRNCASMAFVRF